jgi:ribosomal protein L12E/L44/L45/RPP1/RPP2
MGLSPGYLGRIIDGKLELRIAHILGVCRAIRVPPAAFFLAAYPETLSLEPDTMRLVQALQHLHRQRTDQGVPEPAPAVSAVSAASPAIAPDRERVEQTMKDFLDVLFSELTKGTAAATAAAAPPPAAEPAAPPPARKKSKR